MFSRIVKPLTSLPAMLGLLGVALAMLAFAGLWGQVEPSEKLNDLIAEDLDEASSLPDGQHIILLNGLKNRQEEALKADPAEPFGWARLAYLRLATGDNQGSAFAALQLSDLISPDDPVQLPERALMWRKFRTIENQDQQAYQATLWQKAFRMQPAATFTIAKKNNVTAEAGDAIKAGNSEQYEEWKERVTQKP